MPAYLVKRNRRIQRELDKIKYEDDHKESLCKLVTEEERQKLLTVIKYIFNAPTQLPYLTFKSTVK